MELKLVYKNARCAVLEVADGGIYDTRDTYQLFLNGEPAGEIKTTIHKIYDLEQETSYLAEVKKDGAVLASLEFQTEEEYVTLNVRDFGAAGDGSRDDTLAIQSAIMACPEDGRVLIPAGTYRFVCLFLKDNVSIELAKGAELSAYTDREKFPYYPGMLPTSDGEGEYNLGTWEGDPARMFCGLITGVHVKNVTIYGEGVINGNAGPDNWWKDVKVQKIAWRPRMIFLNHCQNVNVVGITVKNSPSWNCHPYFSRKIRFIGLDILSHKDSANTDGIDPESCRDVEILGVHFSVGDDCIAIKSGKIYMGRTYKTPCRDITVRQCSMNFGHGSVTLGSEMGAGVKDVTVKDCRFYGTDRGLRIKTRRGRGKDAVIDNVVFENIFMDHVPTPFVANSYYNCDADGMDDYVQDRNPRPVDERTPEIRSLIFRNIDARNVQYAAAVLYGLPEKKIGLVEFENVKVSYAPDAKPGEPAMMGGSVPMCRAGIVAVNIDTLRLKNVEIDGQEGEAAVLENVDRVER